MRTVSEHERRSRKRPPFLRPTSPEAPNQDGVSADKGDVNPWQGTARLRRLAALGLAATMALFTAAPAAAETVSPSVAAQIAHAEFLPYMDPPPGEPATVCLVDTGVDLNPDTENNVISRVALDGGDGGDVWERKHGTEMSMVMGAPINGWGTVGAWPRVRIVSVRTMRPGATTFPFNAYAKAIQACQNWPSVRVINLSFSTAQPADTDASYLNDYAASAARAGIALVAGAGNRGGAGEWPAVASAMLAVGAAGPDGRLCDFSARGEQVTVAGPGCGLELADPATGGPVTYAGTSPSAAFVSSVLAAVRSYRPDLTAVAAE